MIDVVTADRIGVLDSSCTGLDHATTRVCTADIFDAECTMHRVYLKVSLPNKTVLAGDLIRWSLAATMQVPVPSRAWLCHVPTRKLDALWPDIDWSGAWGRDIIPGFATASVYGSAPPALVSIQDDDDLIERLRAWPGLLPTIALDLWLANTDDNLSNVLEILGSDGQVRFSTIDGGQILGGDEWTVESVNAQRPAGNRYRRTSKMARAAFGYMLPADVRAKLVRIASRHPVALQHCREFLLPKLGIILEDEHLTQVVMDCLKERARLPWLQVDHGIA